MVKNLKEYIEIADAATKVLKTLDTVVSSSER